MFVYYGYTNVNICPWGVRTQLNIFSTTNHTNTYAYTKRSDSDLCFGRICLSPSISYSPSHCKRVYISQSLSTLLVIIVRGQETKLKKKIRLIPRKTFGLVWFLCLMGAMAMKGYSAFPKAPALLKPHHHNWFVSYPGLLLRWGSYPSTMVQSVYSTDPTDWARNDLVNHYWCIINRSPFHLVRQCKYFSSNIYTALPNELALYSLCNTMLMVKICFNQ